MLGNVVIHQRGGASRDVPWVAEVDRVNAFVLQEGDEVEQLPYHRVLEHTVDGNLAAVVPGLPLVDEAAEPFHSATPRQRSPQGVVLGLEAVERDEHLKAIG